MPKISVVMPTCNTPVVFLKEAVESILNQSFYDFEFIIIDDGSSNEAPSYLDSLSDPRIRLIRSATNLGITKSLNIGFRAATGKYIARMDADDISLPDRLRIQFDFMESNSDVIVCGNSFIPRPRLNDPETYRIMLLFYNPGPVHPTAFFNRALLDKYQLQYNEKLKYSQDYGLWTEISKHGKIHLMKDELIVIRNHSFDISHQHRDEQFCCHKMVAKSLLVPLLDFVSEEEVDFHCVSSCWYRYSKISPEVTAWYQRLIEANDKRGVYNRKKFRAAVWNVMGEIVAQSFEKSMSKVRKAALLFHYLPFPSALYKTASLAAASFRIKVQTAFGKLLS